MEDEREDVAGDEDPVVEFGGEARVFGAEVDDAVSPPKISRVWGHIGERGFGSHLGEREVDCCCVPDGPESDADYAFHVSAILLLGVCLAANPARRW